MGLCAFEDEDLFHPAACLIVWLFFAISVQLFFWPALAVVAALLAGLGWSARRPAWRLIWRAKWLFVSLWLILAYGTPGDLWQGQTWAPSLEGMDAASLHAARLLLLLASLAWLLQALPHERFISGLWALISPLRRFGVAADRSVARLALVFDYLEHAPPRGSWRHFLEMPEEFRGRLLETVCIEITPWRGRDGFLFIGVLSACLALAMLP